MLYFDSFLKKKKMRPRCFCSSWIASFFIKVYLKSSFEVVLTVNSICQLVKLSCQIMKNRNRRECLMKHSTYQLVIVGKSLLSEIDVELFWWAENFRK